MKKVICLAAMSLAILCSYGVGFAAFNQAEGQGARPMSMGGAFIAVADGPEAVFYNPAGLTQIKKPVFSAGSSFVFPKIRYTHTATGVDEESDIFAMRPQFFASYPMLENLYFGFGAYAPFCADMDYDSAGSAGFGASKALAIRIDYSPVVAYKVNDKLSVGGGLILSDGKTKQYIQTSYNSGAYLDDDVDGWDYAWLLGALYNVNDQLKVGGVFRAPMSMTQEGHRLVTGQPLRAGDANINFPATAGIGLAWMPDDIFTVACDLDWNGWGFVYDVDVALEGANDMITILNADDTIDCRLGLEIKPDDTTSMRFGFMYIPGAVDNEYVLPAKPDLEHLYIATIGASKTWNNLEFSLLYEYAWSNEWNITNNVYNYNGRIEADVHILGLDVKYKF